MPYDLADRTLALAGVFQALKLVQQVARAGMTDQAIFENSVKSLFQIDAATPEAVFGSSANLKLGFEVLIFQLGGGEQNKAKQFDGELTKYLINVVVLERKLSKNPKMLKQIATSIQDSRPQVEMFSYTHDNVIARLADLYVNTISTLKPRIMVNGEHHHLANNNNANKIRVLLLTAIRAMVLWRQCGGNRWQLLLQRKQMIAIANSYLRR